MKNVDVLITGINGFIGNNLKRYIELKHPSWCIYGVDIKGAGADFIKVDIRNKKKLKTILCRIKPKYIFHMAGDASAKDFKKLLFSNIYSTFILLEAIQEIENYNPRVLIPSSASEYGKVSSSKMPIDENCQLSPISVYGLSKMVQTNLSLFFNRKRLDIVIARIFNIIGKGTPIYLSMGKFAYELALIKKNMKKPEIYTKSLDSKRDFLDIKDVCRYLVAIALFGKRGEIYNVCRGKSYSIGKMLTLLISISGIKNIKIEEDKNSDEYNIMDSYGSVDKLKEITKVSDLRPVEKSLKDTYFYYCR